MKDGLSIDEARSVLGKIGIPNNFEDRNVYLYRSFDTSYSQRLWFTIHVPETEIRNILYVLSSCEAVTAAFSNTYENINTTEEELDAIDEVVDLEASQNLEEYDPLSTAWALDLIGANYAWKYGFSGSTDITIAVLDTGYTAHSDITCVDMTRAKDVRVDATEEGIEDIHGHGTFIIGQIGAALNGTGINGICKNVTIVPIKIGTYDSETGTSPAKKCSIIAAIEYAEQIQADIINYSYSLLRDTYDGIVASGIEFSGLFIAAAGNNGEEILLNRSDSSEGTGACDGYANDISNWIVVGNSNSANEKYGTSNYSSTYVDLFAPGSSIRGIAVGAFYTKEQYIYRSGTSMAAPHVSAAAALIMARATHLAPVEVKQLLMDTVTTASSLADKCVSGGRLNLLNAIYSLYEAERPAYSSGDADGSCYIDSRDYMIVKRMVLGTMTGSEDQRSGADVDNDGDVDARDYMQLKRYVLKTYYFPPI